MSALTYSLLSFMSVFSYFVNIYGIQNLRYPTRLENNQWRFGKRQDLLSQARYFYWKPALNPGQLYPNPKTPVVSLSYNRYGIPPPAMAPIHQSYMFAIPTKVNYPPYQAGKEIDEKRKPGNLHHITIINAIIPKPYMPTAPTYTHPTTTFRNYRSNNKLLYHQYFNNNNFGRQNMENLGKLNTPQQHKLQHHQQQQQQKQQNRQQQQQQSAVYQNLQTSIPAATLALMVNKPTMEYMNLINYSANVNNRENQINTTTTTTTVPQCGRKTKDDSSYSASNILYYYCNNRILNYKNPSEYYSSQPITTTTPKTTTTPTTTTTKSSRSDLSYYTTERPIFLPTPNAPATEKTSTTPIPTTTRKSYEYEYNFFPTKPTYSTQFDDTKLHQPKSTVKYDDSRQQPQQQRQTATRFNDMKRQQQRHTTVRYNETKLQQPRHTTTKYDDMKRQQQRYTTAVYDDMKLHSFFTIEDAVTSAPPQMQVFNDPYQAYRHARKHHSHHQRQTTTTTKKPVVMTTTKMSILKSFFDDLDEEDYATSEAEQYDYSFSGQPQKSAYRRPEIKNDLELPKRNEVFDRTQKPAIQDSFYSESYQGIPKIKEHNFGLFEAITPTSYLAPVVTTYKPYENFKDKYVTTQKSSHTTSQFKPLSYTTTTEMRSRNEESETTTPAVYPDLRLTTTLATTTTTEKKLKRISMKTPLNLRSTASYKYPKQRGLFKPLKNLTTSTSSTSSTATPPIKKTLKYQRQYKSKKLKQFKHLYTTTSTTSTTTSTTTTAPTTEEYHTKKLPSRTFPATSTTEAASTRKIISRTPPETEATSTRKVSTRSSSTTEANNAKKISSRSSSPAATKETNATKKQSTRRGSKRANKPKELEEPPVATTKRIVNKSRRRPQITSTTPQPTSSYSHTSSSSKPLQPTSRTTSTSSSSTTTTTTMKSIMRIANSKSRSKAQNDIKPHVKSNNDIYDDFSSTLTKDVSIPPLPIEIYFKKSHNAKV